MQNFLYFKWSLKAAFLVTIAAVALWAATDSHYYTKFSVVEKVEKKIDPKDPLAKTGFYEGGSNTETVQRDEFHFGLLPTPSGLFDKHIFSVLSVIFPFCGIAAVTFWMGYRQHKRLQSGVSLQSQQEGDEMKEVS